MIEITRQIVIFGDFKSIDFVIRDRLKEILSKYSLDLYLTQDISINDNNLLRPSFIDSMGYQINQPSNKNNIRPILVSSDNTLNVFIGSNRLHIEENNANLNTYNDFITKAKDIFRNILSLYENVIINRIGMNGQLLLEDEEKMNEWFLKTFKDSNLYNSSNYYEYFFRVVSKIKDIQLNSEINKIILCNKIHEILPNRTFKPSLFVGYDYNTASNPNARFTYNDIEIVIKKVLKFKKELTQ